MQCIHQTVVSVIDPVEYYMKKRNDFTSSVMQTLPKLALAKKCIIFAHAIMIDKGLNASIAYIFNRTCFRSAKDSKAWRKVYRLLLCLFNVLTHD